MEIGDNVYFGPYGDFCVSIVYTIKDITWNEVCGKEYLLVDDNGNEHNDFEDEIKPIKLA